MCPPLHTHTLQSLSRTSLGRDVPVILSALGNAYYSQNGPTEEGIFRLSGNERETAELEKQLNYIPAYISANASIHSIATLIKVSTLSYPSALSLSHTHTHIHSLLSLSLSNCDQRWFSGLPVHVFDAMDDAYYEACCRGDERMVRTFTDGLREPYQPATLW